MSSTLWTGVRNRGVGTETAFDKLVTDFGRYKPVSQSEHMVLQSKLADAQEELQRARSENAGEIRQINKKIDLLSQQQQEESERSRQREKQYKRDKEKDEESDHRNEKMARESLVWARFGGFASGFSLANLIWDAVSAPEQAKIRIEESLEAAERDLAKESKNRRVHANVIKKSKDVGPKLGRIILQKEDIDHQPVDWKRATSTGGNADQ
jgi:hypothetical protein